MAARVQRRREGVRVRRSRGLDWRDGIVRRGVPVTSPARTLSLDALARAFFEAEIRRHLTPDHVEAVPARGPTTRGANVLS